MDIFWRLVLAHFLTDFTLQTNAMAAWKRKSVWGGAAHSLVFLVTGSILCFHSLGDTWTIFLNCLALPGWAALALLTLSHFLEDEWRVKCIKVRKTADSFGFFLWDQAIHLLLIFVFTPCLAPQPPEKWAMLAILFVLTTHFTTIFVYYIDKDFFGYTRLLIQEKYYAMAERLVTGLAVLLPGWWSVAFVVVWLTRVVVRRSSRKYDFSWFSIIAGNTLALLFGLIARLVYYR
jgi:hypothetical protein